MIPLKDENPTKNFPLITIIFIISNTLIFLYQISQPMGTITTFATFGLIPAHLIESPISTYPTIYSSMFIHSGIGHLAGNMLYLWIFGNNIEDVPGKVGFILFHTTFRVSASTSHILTDLDSQKFQWSELARRSRTFWEGICCYSQ